jgi:hypothetical protein
MHPRKIPGNTVVNSNLHALMIWPNQFLLLSFSEIVHHLTIGCKSTHNESGQTLEVCDAPWAYCHHLALLDVELNLLTFQQGEKTTTHEDELHSSCKLY